MMKRDGFQRGFLAGIGVVLLLLTSYNAWQRYKLRAQVAELNALFATVSDVCGSRGEPARYQGGL